MSKTSKFLPYLIIIISSLLAFSLILKPGYFPMHDDFQLTRLHQMNKCIQDHQIPCRWVPDMGYGYGYPLFNFYPPFPYYLGEVFVLLGFNFITSVKLLFFLGFFLSGLFMYLFAKELWGRWGGVVAMIFYIFAPYHAVDVYVRGAMNEFWALTFFPAILWAIYKILNNQRKYFVLLALFYSLLLLSHNIMSMLFTPLIAFWAVFLYFEKNDFKFVFLSSKLKNFSFIIFGILLGLGMASFFVFPALLEKNLVNVESMFSGYFDFRAHFVSISQLFFSRFWGYGPSVWGLDDGMSFQLGIIHWLALLVSLTAYLYLFLRKRIALRRDLPFITFFLIIFALSIFFMHNKSTFIWEKLEFLKYLQFPWRILAFSILSLSIIAGSIPKAFAKINPKFNKMATAAILSLLVICLNRNYFKPEKILLTSDQEKLYSQESWKRLQTDAILDYLPNSALIPSSPAKDKLIANGSELKTISWNRGTNWLEFKINTPESKEVIIPIFYFPEWNAWINGKRTNTVGVSDTGMITLNIPKGENMVYLRLLNTQARSWANLISLISWWTFIVIILYNPIREKLKLK